MLPWQSRRENEILKLDRLRDDGAMEMALLWQRKMVLRDTLTKHKPRRCCSAENPDVSHNREIVGDGLES